VCSSADLLINLGQTNPLRVWLTKVPVRALIDTDPGFTQIRILREPERRSRALQHTVFFSFAGNLGADRCTVPKDGLPWRATRQPIVLDAWPVTSGPDAGRFSTVMQWDSYTPLEYEGRRFGMKSDSFGPYIDLPDRVGPIFDLALAGRAAPRSTLHVKGWRLSDPLRETRDIGTYQQFIQRSKAEFSVAKHGYVSSWSGWFSERSAAYLASARPVVLQDTGFSDWLHAEGGIVPFNNPDEALVGIADIEGRYQFHCRAAREVAEAYFDARRVLSDLIDIAMNRSTRD
jgi:hypothetical protein